MSLSETKKGLWETQEDIRIIRDEINDAVCAELDEIWSKIRDLAVDLCPKESGALASSIEIESEGGSGAIGRGGGRQGEFYSNSIWAGNNETFNFDGQPTSQYAQLVHDGHRIGDDWYEGVPFLEDAVDAYEDELNEAVANALDSLEIGDSNMPSTDKLGDET
ncbi:MAG: hypothetical protein ABSA75_04320 [Candidatus Bathyarchaeia archaeon]|jgi:hypothetical protein